MMRRAIVENGIIQNIIEAEEDFELPGKTLVTAGSAGIGWLWDGEAFSPPPPAPLVIPDRVTSRQFKLQLLSAGLFDQVEAWIGNQDQAIQIAYQASSTFVRDEPMMQAGFTDLGFTPEQIDAFFLAASEL